MKITKTSKRLNKKDIVILLHGWSAPHYLLNVVKRNIPKNFGYIQYRYPKEMLNSDPINTRAHFFQLIKKITDDLKRLNKKKKRNFYIYAQSLGTDFAMVVADEVKIKKIVLVLPGNNLAEAFWKGIKTRLLRKKMQKKGMTLEKLKKIWGPISPDSFFKKNGLEPEYFLVLSEKDKIIPYKNEKALVKMLKRKKVKHNFKISHLKHVPTLISECMFPRATLKFLLD